MAPRPDQRLIRLEIDGDSLGHSRSKLAELDSILLAFIVAVAWRPKLRQRPTLLPFGFIRRLPYRPLRDFGYLHFG